MRARVPFSSARKWSGVSFAGHGTSLLSAPGVVGGRPGASASLPAEVAAEALATASILGRVRPGHKLAAVRALQADGHVVTMVGDGVNDVQALKQADLGIAMAAMAGALVLLFAVPLARRVFALQLPPGSVCAWVACVTATAIAGLTLWMLSRGQSGTREPSATADHDPCTGA